MIPTPIPSSPLRVLHVDHDPADHAVVARCLRQVPGAGCTVRHVRAVTDALRALEDAPADVILLDLNLGSVRGLESLVRVLDSGVGAPVVVLTADQDPTLGVDAIGSGAEDYLSMDDLRSEPFRLWTTLLHAYTRFRKRTPSPVPTFPEVRWGAPVDLDPTRGLLEVGAVLDRYVVEGVLGRGGMAVVYKVRHRALGSVHALKVVVPGLGSGDRRMLQEGRAQARMRHPNLVTATDVLSLQRGVALIMDYVDGPTLYTWMRARRPGAIAGAEALALFRGIVHGVHHAHRHGLVHRDLKPANILVQDCDGRLVPKVTDFGIVKEMPTPGARGTDAGIGMGTPGYMAPEQVSDASSVDARADVFSLGCILYELVCGQPAFAGANRQQILAAVMAGRYQPPVELAARGERAAPLLTMLARMLASDPADRYATCEEVLRALDDVDPAVVGIPARRALDDELLATEPYSLPVTPNVVVVPTAVPASGG